MSEKKSTPKLIGPRNKICPVCGKPSYSPAGIHPQCAVAQADAPRRQQIADAKKLKTQKPR